MFYNDLYENINVVEVLDMAKIMLKNSPLFVDDKTNKKHYEYFIWQTRRKISDIMENANSPLIQITYDTLVDRNAYMQYIRNGVGGYNLDPHELNMKRESELQLAVDSMKDIPLDGYKRYAIIKYSINTEINKLCISTLRQSVASIGKIAVFLWYDFNKRKNDLMFPIITW